MINEKLTVETLQDVLSDVLESYIEESVEHFMTVKGTRNRENARYFYSREELTRFFKLFRKAGGDKKVLHCGIVKDDLDNFFCYEVCHLSRYEATPEAFYS